jgi:hypothetical protein|tara:strand:- start:2464 stop:3099 length:636 start_codon:yes stop_codon:yes gene_type:complete
MSSNKVKQTFICDFDDLNATTPGTELLFKLKEHYPNFKCTCFTPGFHAALMTKKVTIEKFKEWGKLIKNNPWIEVAPHGFAHLRREWLINDKEILRTMLKATENCLEKVLGLDFIKVFKFPFWEGSKEAEEVLLENGYTLAIDRNNPVTHTDIPTYIWSWSIEQPIPKYHTIKAHGHIWLTNNGLDIAYPNLLKMPTDAKFKTIGEYLNEK